MLGSSVTIGRVAGIRIGIHYTWIVIFALLLFSLTVLFREGHPAWSQAAVFISALAATLVFFASIILHELGHSLVAISRGIPVRSITLFIFGGVAQSEEEADSPASEFFIAIAGPLVSIVLAGLFYLVGRALASSSELAATAFGWLAAVNLAVAVFNLVPGFPLDGGRVLRAVVWGSTGDAAKGMRWAVVSGRIAAFVLMLLGVVIVFLGGEIVSGFWLVAIGWFLLSAAEASGMQFAATRLMRGVTIGSLMRSDVPRVAASTSLLEWMDHQVLATGQRAYLVTDGDRVVGLVTLSDSKKKARGDWAATTVREVMTPADALHTVSARAEVMQVLRIMQRDSLNQVPVAEGGEIVGWVDRDRLLQVLRLHMEAGR